MRIKNQELGIKMGALLVVFFILASCFLLLASSTALAQEVPKPGSFNLIVCDDASEDKCDFYDLIELAVNLINALVIISTLIATVAFVYVGFILMTSGGNEQAKTRAKDIGKKVLIGFLWILGAWVLVYTITSTLLEPDQGYDFILGKPQ